MNGCVFVLLVAVAVLWAAAAVVNVWGGQWGWGLVNAVGVVIFGAAARGAWKGL